MGAEKESQRPREKVSQKKKKRGRGKPKEVKPAPTRARGHAAKAKRQGRAYIEKSQEPKNRDTRRPSWNGRKADMTSGRHGPLRQTRSTEKKKRAENIWKVNKKMDAFPYPR